MSDELKQMCEKLTLPDMVELRDYLSDSIKHALDEVGKSPLRCSILLGELASVMEIQKISYCRRYREHYWGRIMVAYQMSREGYSRTEIGHQMMKDHSTVTYMINKMRDALSLPYAYGDIIDIWNKFQKRIDNDIHKGTTENPVSLGGEFPDCYQGEMGKESGEIRTPGDL